MQLSQLGRQWRERKCPIFETVAKGDSNPGSLDCESDILALSYHAPWNTADGSRQGSYRYIQDTNQFIGNHVGWIGIYIIHNTIQAS